MRAWSGTPTRVPVVHHVDSHCTMRAPAPRVVGFVLIMQPCGWCTLGDGRAAMVPASPLPGTMRECRVRCLRRWCCSVRGNGHSRVHLPATRPSFRVRGGALPVVRRVALTSTFTLWIGVCGMRRRLAASVCSGVCFAVSPLVWGYSTTAEVFAMNNLFGTSAVALAPLSACYAIVLHGNSLFDSLAALGQWACCC